MSYAFLVVDGKGGQPMPFHTIRPIRRGKHDSAVLPDQGPRLRIPPGGGRSNARAAEACVDGSATGKRAPCPFIDAQHMLGRVQIHPDDTQQLSFKIGAAGRHLVPAERSA